MIGLLTKPDTVLQVDCEPWLKVVEGTSHALRHGYFITRLPSSKEAGQSWEETRQKESNFFQSSSPWNKVNKRRVGVEKLVEFVSQRLSEMIEQTLEFP